MNREIKFRAWFRGNEDHPAAWIVGFNLVNFHDYFTKELTKKLQRYNASWEPDAYILMQFANQIDSRLREVWEGDILAIDKVGPEYEILGHVVYDSDLSAFVVYQSNGGWEYLPKFFDKNKTAYVYGTIHENPELIDLTTLTNTK
jgi:hypothetical protein